MTIIWWKRSVGKAGKVALDFRVATIAKQEEDDANNIKVEFDEANEGK